jgi:hypothetical protein
MIPLCLVVVVVVVVVAAAAVSQSSDGSLRAHGDLLLLEDVHPFSGPRVVLQDGDWDVVVFLVRVSVRWRR